MPVPIVPWIKRHALFTYFSLAFVISWSFTLPLVGAQRGWLPAAPPFAIHYLASFGPLLAAILVTWIVDGRLGLAQLMAGFGWWRGAAKWLLFCILLPITLFGVAVAWAYLADARRPNLALLGAVDYLPRLGLVGAVLLWVFTFGVGEEVGWRGFALPRLQQRHSALAATMLLSLPWAFWHLPAFFYRDTYTTMGVLTGFPMLLLSISAAAIVFTWMFNSTHGSLLVVTIFHALFDLLSVSKAGGDNVAMIMSAAVMIGAVLIVMLYGPANLSRARKQMIKEIVPPALANHQQISHG